MCRDHIHRGGLGNLVVACLRSVSRGGDGPRCPAVPPELYSVAATTTDRHQSGCVGRSGLRADGSGGGEGSRELVGSAGIRPPMTECSVQGEAPGWQAPAGSGDGSAPVAEEPWRENAM
jgi:hypothetical protein